MYSIFTDHHTISFSTSLVIIVLGALLLTMKIPYASEWKSLKQVRIYLSISYFILGIAGLFSSFVEADLDKTISTLEQAITIVVGSLQALLFTITNLVFIRSSYVNKRNISLNIIGIISGGIGLFFVLVYFPNLFSTIFYIAIAGYCYQIIYYYITFRREYKLCVKRLEEHYEDDEEDRLHWIRNCFYSALCVGIMALTSVAFPISIAVYDTFALIYTLYYAYIVSTVYNYRSEALFLLRAINENEQPTEARTDNKDKIVEEKLTNEKREAKPDEEKLKLEQALENWVENMRYLEKDISIDETAMELGVTRNFLSSYFTTHKSTNFRTWRLELRIHEAERILKSKPSTSISSLHDIVGFADRSNFYRHFTRLVGKTPTQYKDIYKKQNQ